MFRRPRRSRQTTKSGAFELEVTILVNRVSAETERRQQRRAKTQTRPPSEQHYQYKRSSP